MHWDNIGSRWVIPGQNLIDMNLEERQYCRQIYHFLNIDKENKLGGKHAVLFKSLLSLLGEPTWSQSLAEIHRIFTSLKTNIFLGKNALLSSRFVCEILTHQEMAPSWVSTHKNIHAKDKPAQPICRPPAQPEAFPSDLLRPSPKYRGTSGFPVSSWLGCAYALLERESQWWWTSQCTILGVPNVNIYYWWYLLWSPG